MKRIISMCMVWLCSMGLYAQNDGFNPSNPPNPDFPDPPADEEVRYTLTQKAKPLDAASFYSNYNGKQYAAGTQLYMRAYDKKPYYFQHWLSADTIISTAATFTFVMPEHDADLVAVYRFDPDGPANPDTVAVPVKKFVVTLESQPKNGGRFSWNATTEVEEGRQCDIYAYANAEYVFVDWQQDGQTVSTSTNYRFNMPADAVNLVARFRFEPSNPANPSKNYWNATTGEVIIDEFTAGQLTSTINNTISGSAANQVLMITVAGPVNQNDWGVAKSFANCTYLDMSRTYGLTYVPSYNFNGNQVLTTIALPAGIERIDQQAFRNCTALTSLSVYAATPPTIGNLAFDGVKDLVVYVPATALPLYQEADGWKNFTLLPLTDDVSALTVSLPDDADVSLYKDMYIELVNTKSGQTQRYVVTNRRSYTFNSLIHRTSYNVCLKNRQGDVLGQIDGIDIVDEDVSVVFDALKVPRTVSLAVVTPQGDDVTGQTAITWFDAKDTYLTKGSILTGQLEGATVKYRVQLSQTLAMQYVAPTDAQHSVQQSNAISMTLQAIPQLTTSGQVTDVKTGQPLEGTTVSISLLLNGLYSKTFNTRTDADGRWQQQVLSAPATITVSKEGYVSQTVTVDALEEQAPAFALKDINGTTIRLTLPYTTNDGQTHDSYDDLANVDFAIEDLTHHTAITGFNVQLPTIVLMESLPQGTLLRITATSRNHKFMPVTATATVDADDVATATLNIVQMGAISASYEQTENAEVVAILYDIRGNYIANYPYKDKQMTTDMLPDSCYIVVTMGYSDFYNTIGHISQLKESGLEEGTDYVADTTCVTSGHIANIRVRHVPLINEAKLYYTDADTRFYANKSTVTVGQYVTLTAHLGFKPEYAPWVGNVFLHVDLPAGCSLVEGSVMTSDGVAHYNRDDQHIVVPLMRNSETVRLVVTPTESGRCSPSASVQFRLGSKVYMQPIGNAVFTAKDLSINVPPLISIPEVPVSGMAPAGSTVTVYDDGIPIGLTTALANGTWSGTFMLATAVPCSTHEIHATVLTKTLDQLRSETATTLYNPYAIVVSTVTMINTAHPSGTLNLKDYVTVFDFLNPTNEEKVYWYWPNYPDFTFIINMTNNDPEKVKDVTLHVRTTAGSVVSIPAKFAAKQGKWVAYRQFHTQALPINVSVTYATVCDLCTEEGEDDDFIFAGNASGYSGDHDARPVMDPSGYVYEAVPSNRLQGVTATVYYKETVEDIYGDLHENIVIWDAAQYAQQNPLFTDENGMYQWDVPEGLWQVKFEKEGYQTTYSEWLPVPPPQLDVNIAMVQLLQPSVLTAKAFAEGIDVEFDKYMDAETLTTGNIIVTRNGENVEGRILLLNAEAMSGGSPAGAPVFASKVRFCVPQDQPLLATDEVQLTVSRKVKSYAGIAMQGDHVQTFDVEPRVRTIAADSLLTVAYGQQATFSVQALPAAAAKGKTLRVDVLAKSIATVVPSLQSLEASPTTPLQSLEASPTTEVVLDDDGKAVITVGGELPGCTILTLTVEGTDAQAQTVVNVKELSPADVNIDWKVDAADISEIIKVMGGIATPAAERTDVNGDGKTDIADIIIAIRMMNH